MDRKRRMTVFLKLQVSVATLNTRHVIFSRTQALFFKTEIDSTEYRSTHCAVSQLEVQSCSILSKGT